MPQLQPKQINKVISAPIKIVGQSVGASVSFVTVTTSIGAALATAGQNGVSVPLQTSANVFGVGIVTTAPNNKSEIYDDTQKTPITDLLGNEIYGRIVPSGGDYLLNFYYLNSGVETAYTTTDTMTIDFDFVYRFDFNTLPADYAVSSITRNVNLDPKGQNSTPILELVTVTGTNLLSTLSNVPISTTILTVNGIDEFPVGGSPSFSMAGAVITWNAVNAGYSIEIGDVVYANYYI